MSSRHKYENVKIKVRKQWEVARGHAEHISGSGSHDSRPKRLRTRSNQQKFFMREYE